MNQTQLRNLRGFTLVELLIAAGILAILAIVSSQFFVNLQLNQQQTRAQVSREQIRNELERIAGTVSAIKLSRDKRDASGSLINPQFSNCFNIVGGNPTCLSASKQPFTLFTSQGEQISGPEGGNPFRLTIDGVPCGVGSEASTQCPFEVSTNFTPDCGGAISCTRDKSFTIEFTVRISNAATVPARLKILKPATGKVTIGVSKLFEVAGRQQCGSANEVVVGLNPDGSLICRIARSTLSGEECTGTQVLKGFDASGNLRCVSPGGGGGGQFATVNCFSNSGNPRVCTMTCPSGFTIQSSTVICNSNFPAVCPIQQNGPLSASAWRCTALCKPNAASVSTFTLSGTATCSN